MSMFKCKFATVIKQTRTKYRRIFCIRYLNKNETEEKKPHYKRISNF